MTNTEYRKAFTETLGKPEEYYFNGLINDNGSVSGRCICGHPIRYEFGITNGNTTYIVGSECIKHFQGINDKLYEDLKTAEKEWKDEIREAEKKKGITIMPYSSTIFIPTYIEKITNPKLKNMYLELHTLTTSGYLTFQGKIKVQELYRKIRKYEKSIDIGLLYIISCDKETGQVSLSY